VRHIERAQYASTFTHLFIAGISTAEEGGNLGELGADR
jgi:hypothetical protein